VKRVGVGSEGPSQEQQSSLPGYQNERLKPARIEGIYLTTLWSPLPMRLQNITELPVSRRYANKSSIDIRLFPVLGDVEAGSLNFGIGS
jgi:hypothetical protein